ncbi:MAG: PaaI family thioesterase [Proteobacteria bacterium]|nr:PaaI family thioesterase [Pseudomonadota bacterium]
MLGFELVSCDAGRAEIALALREELTNSRDMAHGGVSMTLLDVVMAHAARSPNQPGHPESHGVVTIEMKTTFMRPGTGRLRALGHLVHRTPTMAFCEGTIVNESGAIVAQSTGTFKYVRPLPTRRHPPLDTAT